MADQVSIHPHSILVRSPLLRVGGDLEWGIRKPCDSPIREDETKHLTKDHDKLTILAFQYYGDVRLWWILYDYNTTVIGKNHPLMLPAGLMLRIPNKDRINLEVLNVQTL
jgi:hypothetical protein